MAKTKKVTHTHKYLKVDIGVNAPFVVYKCVLDCTHYLRATYKLMRGVKCICWRCGKEFILGRTQLKNLQTKPHCDDCIVRKKPIIPDTLIESVIAETTDDFIGDLMEKMR